MPEPELFVERIQEGSNSVLAPACKKTPVTPLRLSKAGNDSHWQVQVEPKQTAAAEIDVLNPDRIAGKQFDLVHRNDNKLCPKSVKRCEQCRISFNQADLVLVKTVGVREHTDKSGKHVKHMGNVYLHYLTKCLKEFDQNFSFGAVNVPARTLTFLPKGSSEKLREKGLHVEDGPV
ncbi:Hypothetical predicted protein [Paramuricea clavata]|uniref:Uncharacterized protein n=1 Tax=Paramuricea clavata TaxID=317549 RepID=A0A7D9LJJ8_PARCT|nr:Hypothetical predicted protein [Paramuricea clavata]